MQFTVENIFSCTESQRQGQSNAFCGKVAFPVTLRTGAGAEVHPHLAIDQVVDCLEADPTTY
jgi:hypothetical protein